MLELFLKGGRISERAKLNRFTLCGEKRTAGCGLYRDSVVIDASPGEGFS